MIVDTHCDVLMKLWERPQRSFHDSDELRINYIKWMDSPVQVQWFAIFVPEEVPSSRRFEVALEMVGLFYDRIIAPYSSIKLVTSKEEIAALQPNEKGALLTLEGCHPIGDDLTKLLTLLRLGVTSVGLTWNQANAVCDGIQEERGAGLSSFGKKVVRLLNDYKVWTDVSHLSYQGFWDVLDIADYPMASHSNAYTLTPHIRNLNDKQLDELIKRNAYIGVTFVADFLTEQPPATIDDIMIHLQYIIDRGGERCVGLGSDFDGTNSIITGLYDISEYEHLYRELSNRFSNDIVKNITNRNILRTMPK